MPFEASLVKTVTVDSYGTLVDPASIRRTLSEHVDDPTEISNLWFSRALLNKLVANSIGVYEPFDVLSRDSLNYALDYHDVRLSDADKAEILAAYDELEVFDGVEEGIRRVADAGYEVYVVSNGTQEMLASLVDHVGVEDVVAGMVSADDVQTYKPAAEIYRHAADRADTPTERVLHVSGPYFDVLGAMHAGMQGGWINYGGRPRDRFAGGPDLEVTSLVELADLLPGRDDR